MRNRVRVVVEFSSMAALPADEGFYRVLFFRNGVADGKGRVLRAGEVPAYLKSFNSLTGKTGWSAAVEPIALAGF